MTRLLTFEHLKWASFAHSTVYFLLLLNLFVLDSDTLRPLLGWAHGIAWIVMALVSVVALRRGVIDLRLAVAIAVLGGVGPFFGSAEFIRQSRHRGKGAKVQPTWP